MLINVKKPTIVGILTFMSRIILCSAELSMEKSFITSGPDQPVHQRNLISLLVKGSTFLQAETPDVSDCLDAQTTHITTCTQCWTPSQSLFAASCVSTQKQTSGLVAHENSTF